MLIQQSFFVTKEVRKWWKGFGKDLDEDIEANS